MKKSILLILTLTFSLAFANAQISVMPYFQGDLSHFATFPSQENEAFAQSYLNMSKHRFAPTFGIGINYVFNENWEFKTGIEFQEAGNRLEGISDIHPYPVPLVKATEAHRFINIPLQIQYNFITDSKISPFLSFGTSLNWNFSNQIYIKNYLGEKLVEEYVSNQRERYYFEPRNINIAFQFDFGIKRQFTEKLSANAFLSGNMLYLTTIKDDIYNARHYNIGLGFGLAYTI